MKRYITFLLIGAIVAVAARAAEFQLIAHSATPATALSKEEAKDILLGTKGKWDNGTIIKLAILSGGAVHDKVINDLTARSADQFDKYWKKQVFTGKGVMPEAVADDAAMIAYVAKTPGAFGYVSGGAKAEGVKTLPVQ